MPTSAAGKLSVTKTRNNPWTKHRPFYQVRGFTLIELTIVLFIFSIVLALTAPGLFRSFGNLTLKTAAKKVGGTLRYSRSQAVNTGSIYNTIFDTEKNRVIVLQIPSPAAHPPENIDEEESDEKDADIPAKQELKAEIKTYPLPDGIIFEQILIADIDSKDQDAGGIYQISFLPDGHSRGGEIILADEKERMYRISVNSTTGVVTIAEVDDQ